MEDESQHRDKRCGRVAARTRAIKSDHLQQTLGSDWYVAKSVRVGNNMGEEQPTIVQLRWRMGTEEKGRRPRPRTF